MHSGHIFSLTDCAQHDSMSLIQSHGRRIQDFGPGPGAGDHLPGHQGAGIQNKIRLLHNALPLNRDQLRIARSGTYKNNLAFRHHFLPVSVCAS